MFLKRFDMLKADLRCNTASVRVRKRVLQYPVTSSLRTGHVGARGLESLEPGRSCNSSVFFSARLEHVVLVDDERANFRNDSSISAAKVLRYCKVRKDSVLRSLRCKIRGFVMVQECEWR